MQYIYIYHITDSFQMIHQHSSSILVNPPELDQPPGAPSASASRTEATFGNAVEMVITVSVDVLVGVLVDAWMLGYNDVGDVIMEFYSIIMDIYIYIMILVFSSA